MSPILAGTAWPEWATGVLNGLGAPIDSANVDTLWAWGCAESLPYDPWHILNPLDSTLWMPGAVAWNTFGNPPRHVWIYASLADSITATVNTLTAGYYPIICSHLATSIPRYQWADACAELGTWGTGCGWLHTDYGIPPGNLTGDNLTQAEFDALVAASPLANLVGLGSTILKDVQAVSAAVALIPIAETPDPDLTILTAKVDALAGNILAGNAILTRIEAFLSGTQKLPAA